MSMMDLKSKGITWVGNIYQKFETICHEVDNVVSQDAVKYVEGQVHTVGESMKKFYSDVVQDLIPSSVDPANCEAQGRTQQKNAAIGTHTKSMIGIEKDYGDTVLLKESPMEPSDFDPVMKQLGNAFSGLHLVNHSTATTSGELLEGEESESVPGSIDDVSINENSGFSTEENAFMGKSSAPEVLELMPPGKKESFEAPGEFVDFHCENARGFSTPTSVHGEKFQPPQNVGTVCLSSADNSYCVSDPSANAFKENSSAPEVLELMAPGKKASFEASGEFIDCSHESGCGFLADVLALASVHGEKFQSPQNVGAVCLADVSALTSVHVEKFQSPQNVGAVSLISADNSHCDSNAPSTVSLSEMAFSIVSAEKKILDKKLSSSSSSIFTEHHSLSENPLDNIDTKVGSFSNSFNATMRDSDGSSLLLSPTSAPTVSCEIKEMGLPLSNSVLSLESIGCSDDSSHMTNDLTDSEMETIDLTDKVKLEESCVIVDDRLLYEVSRRTRKFRSYKEKIQDAFTSRKRLTKEYEQLAIWYGDLDIGSSQHTMQGGLLSSTTIILDSDLQSHQTQDCEWELL